MTKAAESAHEHGHGHHERHGGVRHRRGRQAVLPHRGAHVHGVDDVVERLHEHAEHGRDGEFQQQLERAGGAHAVDLRVAGALLVRARDGHGHLEVAGVEHRAALERLLGGYLGRQRRILGFAADAGGALSPASRRSLLLLHRATPLHERRRPRALPASRTVRFSRSRNFPGCPGRLDRRRSFPLGARRRAGSGHPEQRPVYGSPEAAASPPVRANAGACEALLASRPVDGSATGAPPVFPKIRAMLSGKPSLDRIEGEATLLEHPRRQPGKRGKSHGWRQEEQAKWRPSGWSRPTRTSYCG